MNYTEQQLTAAVVSARLRPALAGLESSAPESLLSLIQKCWEGDPRKRPSFDDIVSELDTVLEHQKIGEEDNMALHQLSISLGDQLRDSIENRHICHNAITWFKQGEEFSKQASLTADSRLKFWFDPSSDPLTYHPVLSCGSFATCGRRENMEDTHFLMPYMGNEQDIHLFGIFDGHRGVQRVIVNTKGALSGPNLRKNRFHSSYN